jgi:hypothetical protein
MAAQNRNEIRRFLAAAALDPAPARVAGLEAIYPAVQGVVAVLRAVDYGDAQPADRFRPPPSG